MFSFSVNNTITKSVFLRQNFFDMEDQIKISVGFSPGTEKSINDNS